MLNPVTSACSNPVAAGDSGGVGAALSLSGIAGVEGVAILDCYSTLCACAAEDFSWEARLVGRGMCILCRYSSNNETALHNRKIRPYHQNRVSGCRFGGAQPQHSHCPNVAVTK